MFPGERYPDRPGFVARDTSIEAARSIEPQVSKLAAQVLDLLAMENCTCWEIEQRSGMSHQTASARVRELYLKGKIKATDERRLTGSGRKAIVWARIS
jgi:hypothetical protein